MQKFLIFTLLSSMAPVLTAAEYTTAETSHYSRTYQQPPRFEHVFGSSKVYVREKPEPGINIEDLLSGIVAEEAQPEQEADPDRRAWERYCDNEALTKEEYLIIDAGNIPEDLKAKCARKGKMGSASKAGASTKEPAVEVETTEPQVQG